MDDERYILGDSEENENTDPNENNPDIINDNEEDPIDPEPENPNESPVDPEDPDEPPIDPDEDEEIPSYKEYIIEKYPEHYVSEEIDTNGLLVNQEFVDEHGETLDTVGIYKSGDVNEPSSQEYGNNAGVLIYETDADIIHSEIITQANNSMAIMSRENATVDVINSSIYTTSNNSAVFQTVDGGKINVTSTVSIDNGDISIDSGVVATEGTNSPAIKIGKDGSDISLESGIYRIAKSTFIESISKGSTISLENTNVTEAISIADISKPTKINIKSSEFHTTDGFALYNEDERDETDYEIHLTDNNIQIIKTEEHEEYPEPEIDTEINISDYYNEITEPVIIVDNISELFIVENGDFTLSLSNNAVSVLHNVLVATNMADVSMTMKNQIITGDIYVDETSALKFKMLDKTSYTGAIVSEHDKPIGPIEPIEPEPEPDEPVIPDPEPLPMQSPIVGALDSDLPVRVVLKSSTWTLNGDSYVSELLVDKYSRVNLNGYTLTVNGIKSDFVVGSVVNYNSVENDISQANVVIIEVKENDTFTLYDTDDKITYNDAMRYELTFTGKMIDDMQSILDDLDARARNEKNEVIENGDIITIGTADTNCIVVDNEEISYSDVTLTKTGDTKIEEPEILNHYNAAVLVKNAGVFEYSDSVVTTNGNYSPGMIVKDDSLLNLDNIELSVNGSNSTAIGSINSDINARNTLITDSSEDANSYAILATDNSSISFTDSIITSNNSEAAIKLDNQSSIHLNKVKVESASAILDINTGSTIDIKESNLIAGTCNEVKAIDLDENCLATIENSTITVNNSLVPMATLIGESQLISEGNTYNTGNCTCIEITGPSNTVGSTNDIFINTGIDHPVFMSNDNEDTNIILNNCIFNAESGDILWAAQNSTTDVYLEGDITGNFIVIHETATLTIHINGNFTGNINRNGKIGYTKLEFGPEGTFTVIGDSFINEIILDQPTHVNLDNGRLFVNETSYRNVDEEWIDIDTGYSTIMYPTQRTLRICLSRDLPYRENRDKHYMYFAYDHLRLYVYQSQYTDPFCIVEDLPEDKNFMVQNMLYITMKGYVYSYMGNSVVQLGTVEDFDPAQLDLLKKCGTTYFMNAESRYLDVQTRTIQLPFQNGSYQLNLSLAKDLMIDEDTVIKFDMATEQFYIAGKEYQWEDKLNNVGRYSAIETRSVKTTIDGHNFRSEVKISPNSNNALKLLANGLYIDTYDLAKSEDYYRMVNALSVYKDKIDGYVEQFKDAIMEIAEEVSADTIANKILEALQDYSEDITEALAKYQEYGERIDEIEQSVYSEITQGIEEAKDDIKDYINQVNNAWEPIEESESEDDYTTAEYTARAKILSDYKNIIKSLRNNIVVSSYSELPTTGDSKYKYFVINYVEEEHSYFEYRWDSTTNTYVLVEEIIIPEYEEEEPDDNGDEEPVITGAGEDDQEDPGEDDPEDPGEDPDDPTPDPEPEPENPDTIPDKDYSYNGLSMIESAVQDYIISIYNDIRIDMKRLITVEYVESLPVEGDRRNQYFVIRYDEENPVYQTYSWIPAQYDESGVIEVEGHYELIYDMYPVESESEPEPEPELPEEDN